MGLACVYHGFTKWMTGLHSDSWGAVVQAVVFPGLRMWDEVSFSPPINRTVCTSVFFFTEKCALCWIAYQLFQTRNVKVLKLPVVLKTDVLFSLTCCGHRARCFTNSPLLEYKLEASEVIVEVSVRSSAEIETTLKKIWIPSKAIFPYSS